MPRFEVLKAVIINITVFRDVTLCSLAGHYQCFKGMGCLNLQARRVPSSILKMDAKDYSKILVTIYQNYVASLHITEDTNLYCNTCLYQDNI
jgi:hypothetical protein